MFESFQRNFRRDPENHGTRGVEGARLDSTEVHGFLTEFGAASFQDGLYRTIHSTELDVWRERVSPAFPDFEGRITCFAYDWLGRAFALDTGRLEGGQSGVVMFEPGTAEALEIPANLVSFHETELQTFGDAALAIDFYQRWRASGGSAPNRDQCIGYRVPLFLGGSDEIDNLELSNLDVYWHILGQLIRETRGLPDGTPVRLELE